MYDRAVPVALNGLNRVDHLLDWAPKDLTNHQFAPDMLDFDAQIRTVIGFCGRLCFPITGKDVPQTDGSIPLAETSKNYARRNCRPIPQRL